MLERTKQGHKLLDLGCAFGQELRQLVSSVSPNHEHTGSLLEGFESEHG